MSTSAQFPRGKIAHADEGQTQIAIAVLPDNKTLVIDFGKPTAWIGLGKKEALALIATLTKLADKMIAVDNADMD